MTDERWRVAVHEAAHAWAYHRFGFGVGAVSVQPGRQHLGVALSQPQSIDITGHPLDGMNPTERRRADRVLVAILIGAEAEAIFMPRTGRQPDPVGYIGDTGAMLDALAPPGGTVAPLAPVAAARLKVARADPNPQYDDLRAEDLAYRIVGAAWAPYLLWARAEARILAAGPGAAPIHALADSLSREETIGGPEAVATFQEAQENPSE